MLGKIERQGEGTNGEKLTNPPLRAREVAGDSEPPAVTESRKSCSKRGRIDPVWIFRILVSLEAPVRWR